MNTPEEQFISRAQRNRGMKPQKIKQKSSLTAGKVIRRVLLCLGTLIVCAVIAVAATCNVLLKSGCEPLKVKLVLSATQASATKWAPGLFIPQSEVDRIVAESHMTTTDEMSLEEYSAIIEEAEAEAEDKWADAIDGMILEIVHGPTFTGYLLSIKDPSRVFIGTASDDFKNCTEGMRIFKAVDRENAVAAINGGEFQDPGGVGVGNQPMGLTYSRGKCVWNDGLKRTFIGFDENNRLIVRESMTKAEADALHIRDAISFQNDNTLITNETDAEGNITNVKVLYADNNTGTAQRTSIGQTADGTVLLLVTDGRSASSLGATRNDVIELMVERGAVSAGMLDGGSSSMMLYRGYYDKYPELFDKSKLDEYQLQGLVNKYKAFTTPRRMPTFICVSNEG